MNLELTQISSVTRNTNFSSLTNNIVPVNNATIVETVTAVEIVADIEDSGITLSTSLSNVSVSGSYEGLFNDSGEYVSKGSSNLIEDVTEFTSISDLPPNKDFYLFEQDTRNSVTVTYTVTVTFDRVSTVPDEASPPGPPTVTTENDLEFIGTFTHQVNNDTTLGFNIVSTYYV